MTLRIPRSALPILLLTLLTGSGSLRTAAAQLVTNRVSMRYEIKYLRRESQPIIFGEPWEELAARDILPKDPRRPSDMAFILVSAGIWSQSVGSRSVESCRQYLVIVQEPGAVGHRYAYGIGDVRNPRNFRFRPSHDSTAASLLLKAEDCLMHDDFVAHRKPKTRQYQLLITVDSVRVTEISKT